MESRTQFKCLQCNKSFETSEVLENHTKRHEMSINLSTKPGGATLTAPLSTPILSKGSLSAGVIGFVDETPTPTRFIRNCEEVGLFQDLQNVNPFDEVFKKAAGHTPDPSSFEFSFSSSVIGVPATPLHEGGISLRNSRSSKRRYSEQDTLNTPQIFPYFHSTAGCHTLSTNTASMSTCLTPTPQNSVGNENLESNLHQTPPADSVPSNVPSTSYNHEEHVSIIAYTSAISQQKSDSKASESASKKTPSPPVISSSSPSLLKIRSKAKLKLDLKTVTASSSTATATLSEKTSGNVIDDPGSSKIPDSERTNVLERNRAAAYRSRERRKQWIYGLESRCRTLEALLSQSQTEVARLRKENEALKIQLKDKSPVRPTPVDTTIQRVADDTTQEVVQELVKKPDNAKPSQTVEVELVSPIVLPTLKAKRGRPRKGEERRVPIAAVPILQTTEPAKVLPKIPILPVPKPKII